MSADTSNDADTDGSLAKACLSIHYQEMNFLILYGTCSNSVLSISIGRASKDPADSRDVVIGTDGDDPECEPIASGSHWAQLN
jgi:hypothetical protein